LDEVRGGHCSGWKQLDDNQAWLGQFSNLFALGRLKGEASCHFWTASLEAMLRWSALANDWYVEELECGSVTGTYDCVFAFRSVKS
jgi:hypothetical protein